MNLRKICDISTLCCLNVFAIASVSACYFSENAEDGELISKIESGFQNYTEQLKKYHKVKFDLTTHYGKSSIEVSSLGENFILISEPAAGDTHYQSSVFGFNEQYGFKLARKKDSDGTFVIETVTDSAVNESGRMYVYPYSLATILKNGMVSTMDFIPIAHINLSDRKWGLQSASQSKEFPDQYIIRFQPSVESVALEHGAVFDFKSITSGMIVFSEKLGFLPIKGELERRFERDGKVVRSWREILEWEYDHSDGCYRLSRGKYVMDDPNGGRLDFTDFEWITELSPDEFELTRFGFSPPTQFQKPKSHLFFWLGMLAIAIILLGISWHFSSVRRKKMQS